MTVTTSERRFAYKPALDGLRAFAVAAVIAYHFGYGWASGGFLGVDTFFVLSGYLITSLLVGEWSATGAINRVKFWARRARRLLPALMIVLLAVAIYGAVALPANQLGKLRGDGLATLFYTENWRLIFSHQSYFDLFSAPSPLRHAWSLAIEEQFYILWPLIVIACLKLGRGARGYLVAFCVIGTIASVALMAVLYRATDPSRAYYGTDTRAQLLLVGALLALLLERWQPRGKVATNTVHVAGLAFGIACLAAYVRVGDKDAFMYHGGYLLFAIAVTCVIASAVLPGKSPVRALLALGPLCWIGQISYGLYLWHWPVQVYMTPRRTGLQGLVLNGARLGTTLGIAVVSYYVVELPIRRGVLVRGRLARVAVPAAAVAMVIVILVATAGAVGPSAVYTAPKSAATPKLPPAPASTTPPVTAAQPVAVPNAPPPPPPPPPPPRTIALVGDSVVDSLVPGMQKVVGARGARIVRGAIDGCPVANGVSTDPNGAPFKWSFNCLKVVPDFEQKLIAQQRPDLVVWLSTWETADRLVDGKHLKFGTPEHDAALLQAMEDARVRLTAYGARIDILTVPPLAATDFTPDPKSSAIDYAHLNGLIRRFARSHPDNVNVIDFADIVCPGGYPCPEVIDGLLLRPDGGHFTKETSVWVADRLVPQLFNDTA
jgi:peptidoglycan/LPS O-acetylase OafA/YrhL